MLGSEHLSTDKLELIQRLITLNNATYLSQVRQLLDVFQNELEPLTTEEMRLAAEGRRDIEEGRVWTQEEFDAHFANYEV